MGCSNGKIGDDIYEKSFRIKPDDNKVFTRLLSKETSKSNPSFRLLYYGNVSGAVPFTWETRPGTPKYYSESDSYNIVPPLTPPPSYSMTNSSFKNSSMKINGSKSKLILHTLLRRMNPRKSQLLTSPQSFSSSRSISCTKQSYVHRRSLSCFGDDRVCLDEEGFCVGINGKENRQKLQSAFILKKAFFSIVGRGST